MTISRASPILTEDAKWCLYARKSSESDEKQAMSIDAQLREMQAIAERENLNIVDIKQESKSAKATGVRTEYNQLITDISEGKVNAILTWAPDRLSRNASTEQVNGNLRCKKFTIAPPP